MPKKVFPVKNWKSEHWIPHIQSSLCTKFQFKLKILIFLTGFTQKRLKQKKWTLHIFYIILHIQISLVRSFSSNWQFWFFGSNLPRKIFPVENKTNEYHHGIPHIWIILVTKLHRKLIILSFWTKFTQKGISSRKQNKQFKDYKPLLFK